MPNYKNIAWQHIDPGRSPVCLVGAGFPLGILKKKPPSTEEIIQDTVKNHSSEFPILSKLSQLLSASDTALNCVWQNIKCLANLLCPFYRAITADYNSSNLDYLKNVMEFYKSRCASPQDILWVLLGLELKKAISLNYGFKTIGNCGNWNTSALQNIKHLLGKTTPYVWISLNYDLILENLLIEHCEIAKFNMDSDDVAYSFAGLIEKPFLKIPSCKHLIVKPHGSVNVIFETRTEMSDKKYHSLRFADSNDFTVVFSYNGYGYNSLKPPFIEKRAWLVGYLPDDAKDELNSKALFSDMAHDLCKWNMSTTSFALGNASSLIIIGYRMPPEDEWIWKRVKNLFNKSISIYIASGSKSNSILKRFAELGFKRLFLVNGGWLDNMEKNEKGLLRYMY